MQLISVYARELSHDDLYVPSQLSGLSVWSAYLWSLVTTALGYPPQSVNGPGVGRTSSRAGVPELDLQDLSLCLCAEAGHADAAAKAGPTREPRAINKDVV